MTDQIATPTAVPAAREPQAALRKAGAAWFWAAAIGQLMFVLFILLFYYGSILRGDIQSWNDKPLITGFVGGDAIGNLMFAVHVMMAAVLVAGGIAQLIPAIRNRWPALHRWNGRLFMVCALALALGGLWLVWVRGTYMNLIGALGISFNALLIISFALLAWRAAIAGQYARHRRWALRLFVVANAVWFMRIGYMLWGVGAGGAGIGRAMDGPFDYFLAFGNSLVPLGLMELYLRVQQGGSDRAMRLMTGTLWIAALLTAAGSVMAWLIMWGPYVGLSPVQRM